MAEDVARLLINIEASTASLRKQMADADKVVANATKGIDGELTKVDKAFARLGLAAGKARQAANTAMIGISAGAATAVAGVTALTMQVVNTARAVQNLSSVANASTTEFQRYAVGAKAVGIEQEKLSDILKDVNDRIGDFVATGGGPMKDFFEQIAPRIGVTAEQFRKLSGPQALQLYYDSLQKANLSQADMTFYLEAMASDTTALIPLLRNGGEGFKLFADEAERAGAILDDKTIRASQELNAALYLMNSATEGVKNQIVQALLPTLVDFAEELSTVSVNGNVANEMAGTLATTMKALAATAVGAYASFQLVGKGIAGLAAIQDKATEDGAWYERFLPPVAAYRLYKNWQGVKDVAGVVGDDLEETASHYADILNKIWSAGEGSGDPTSTESRIQALAKFLSGAREAAGSFSGAASSAATAIDKVDKALDGVDADGPAKAIKEFKDRFDDLHDSLNPAEVAARKYKDQQEFLNEVIARGGEEAVKATRDLDLLREQYEANTKATSDWAKWTEGALDRVDSAFADAWRNIGDGFSSFRDSLTNAFKQMLAELAHMAITKPIIMQIGAMMGIGSGTQGNNGIWGGLLGGGGGSGGGAGGMNWGSLVDIGKNIYSVYDALTGVGSAMYTGYQSGGLTGALGGGANYYGSMLSNAYSTIAQWFGGAATSAATTAATEAALAAAAKGTAGYMLDVTTGQIVNTATTAGANAVAGGAGGGGVLSSISGMLSNPYTWAIAGMMASYKLYGQGVKADGSEVRDTFKESGSSGAADVLGDVLGGASSAIRLMDKALTHIFVDPLNLFGDAADKFTAVITGSPVTQAVNLALARLFGGGEKYKRTVGSAQGSYSAGEYTGNGAVESWFDGSRRFGDDFDQSLHGLNEAFASSLGGLFEMFDIDSDIMTEAATRLRRTSGRLVGNFTASFDEAVIAISGQYSRKGNTQAGLEQFFDDVMGRGLSQAIGQSQLPEYLKELTAGLTKAAEVSEAVGGLFARFDGVNTTIETLNFRVFEMTDAGLRGADALLDLSAAIASLEDPTSADKIASLTALTATYYDQFFTAAEKTEDTISAITRAFESADVELADSREAYRAMVEDIDLTTAAGREMFATLMALSGQAAQYFSIVEQQAAQTAAAAEQAAAQALANALLLESRAAQVASVAISASQGALGTLSAAINAEKSSITSAYQSQANSIRSAISSASDALSQMRSVAGTLRNTVNGLRFESEQYDAQSRRSAQQIISKATSSGGRLQMTAELERALDTVSQSSEDLFGSFEDYARDYWQTYFAIESLADKAEDQLTAEERTVKALETQLDQASRFHSAELERLDGVLEGSNAQLEALLGINSGVLSVEAALAVVASSIGALKQLQNANSSITSVTGLAGVKRQVTSEGYILDDNGEHMQLFGEALRVIGNKVIGGAGSSMNIGADGQLSWAEGDYEKWAKSAGIPGFASGGSHRGGLRLVGENGPELEVTGPSRIYNASQTAAMLGGGGDAAAEVRGLRADFGGMMSALRSVAKHTMQTAKRVEFLERWDFDGLPKERATA